MTERHAPDPVPDAPHNVAGGPDPLADLLALVTERARRLSASETTPDAMDGLRDAVDALGRYLDVLAFLRTARAADAANGGPAPTAARREDRAPDRPEAMSADDPPAPPETAIEPLPGPLPEAAAPPGPPGPEGLDGTAERDFPPFRDQLTGLHSREGFDAVAAGELKRCRRHGRVFSMLLFELAGLDESGLSRAASAILASIRESDLAGRRDAKVLSVALPETSPTEARLVAERILRQFEGAGAWGTWARLALVTHPTHGETLRHLLDASRVQLTLPTQRVLASAENGHWPG